MAADQGQRPAGPAAGYGAGYAAAGLSVLIWAGWILVTRQAVRGALTPADVALLRFAVPALLLAPVILRRGLFPRGASPALVAVMALGWGTPFIVLTATGLQSVPAAQFGALTPGTMPVWAILIGRLALGERLGRAGAAGVALMLAGAALTLVPAALGGRGGDPLGYLSLLAASVSWAAFTVAHRRSGLNTLETTAYVGLYSTLMALGLTLAFGSAIPDLSPPALGWHLAAQGLLSGFVAVAAFAFAASRLGAPRAAAFSALVPVLAALGGWTLLGETVIATDAAAVVAASLGVATVNGVFGGRAG